MRVKTLRVIAGLLGIYCVVMAIFVAVYARPEFWPSWMFLIPEFLVGGLFLFFAFTGNARASFYRQRIFGSDEEPKDR